MRVIDNAGLLIADLVFPRLCAGCGTRIAARATWCPGCLAALLEDTAIPYCPRCGCTRGPHLKDDEGCPSCARAAALPDGFARVGRYRGLLGDMVRNYKLRRREYLAGPLSRLLADAICGRPWADDVDLLVPIPTTWSSRLQYGFQPVRLLAERAGRLLGVPVRPVLRNRGKKRRQTGLAPYQRRVNVRGTFDTRRSTRLDGLAVCLIDDVCTTGSTLHEAARVLRHAGAEHICAAVLARSGPADVHLAGG